MIDFESYKDQTIIASILFLNRFRVFAKSILDPANPEDWIQDFSDFLHYPDYKEKLDHWVKSKNPEEYNGLIKLIDFDNMKFFPNRFEKKLSYYFGYNLNRTYKWLDDIAYTRNGIVHGDNNITVDDINSSWLNMERIAVFIKDPELQNGLKTIKDKLDNQNKENKTKELPIIETQNDIEENKKGENLKELKKKTKGGNNYKKIFLRIAIVVALAIAIACLIWFYKDNTDTTKSMQSVQSKDSILIKHTNTDANEEPLRQALLELIDTKKTRHEREELAVKVWSEYFYPEVYIDNLMDKEDKNPEHWSAGNGKSYLAHLVTLPSIIDIKILAVERDKETQKVSGLKVLEIHNGSMIKP